MARAGDKDEAGPGAAVAQLSDAASRHTKGVPARRPRKRPDPPPQPDPNAGTGLISNLDAGEPDEIVGGTADDKLDQVLARQQSSLDRKPRALSVPEAPERDPQPDQRQDAYQLVRDTLDHHHERYHPRQLATTTPRGSAELAADARRVSSARRPRSRGGSATSSSRPKWVGRVLVAVVGLLVIAVVAVAVTSSLSPKRHGAVRPTTRAQTSTSSFITPFNAIALHATSATIAIATEVKSAEASRAAAEARARAKAKARRTLRARSTARARDARARRRREATARTRTTPASSALTSVPSTSTRSDSTYTAPSSSSTGSSPTSSSSTSATGGGSGAPAPAGPTAVGSTGSNCDPKCS
jgi:hypothetical protein